MSKPNAAAQALQLAKSKQPGSSPIEEVLRKFFEAVREANPDMTFTVIDIRNWAEEYQKLTDEQLPSNIFNTFSVGRYLNKEHEKLGIQAHGTYGNRCVWALKEEE